MTRQDTTDCIAQLITHLKLAIAQSQLSLKDAGHSVAMLTNSFIDMLEEVNTLKSAIAGFESKDISEGARTELNGICDRYLEKSVFGTIGFQFYDKLSQRLNHMTTTLEELLRLLEANGAQASPEQWQAIEDSVRRRYTMEQDKALLEHIRQGASVEHAIHEASKPQEHDIELF